MKTCILAMILLLSCEQQRTPASSQPGDQIRGQASATPRSSLPEARIPGLIDNGRERTSDVISAPATVRAGEGFEVTITTFGGGCEREGETSVILTGSGATLMVYDFTTATHPGVVCTMIFKRLPHRVTLNFSEPGEKIIRVWGRRVGSETPPIGVPTVLEQRVLVERGETSQVSGQSRWVVTEKGAGPVRVGMTVAEAQQALGSELTAMSAAAPCYYVKPQRGPSGIAFMVTDGRIARVDVANQTVATEAGARIGDSEAQIRKLYPRAEVSPHKYVKGHYLTAMPAGDYRIVFETDGEKVTRYRAGRTPEVRWVEGCS